MKCKECKYCEFIDRNGRPNIYFCDHPCNPSSLAGTSSCKKICTTERRSDEFKIKKTPKWCPLEKE